jgi:hypothetical protein
MANKSNLGVQWTLPGKKKPFGYTTKATSDLIVALAEPDLTVRDVQQLINYDDEAKAVLQHFIDAGLGDDVLASYVG